MTKDELAAILNGRQVFEEITPDEAALAEAAGLVVVFGYSDDSIEFRGAVNEEVTIYDSDPTLSVTCTGEIIPKWKYSRPPLSAAFINCELAPDDEGPMWRITTDTPHAKFNVMEGTEIFCQGIVFALADIPPASDADVKDVFTTWAQTYYRNAATYTQRDFDIGLSAWKAATNSAQPVSEQKHPTEDCYQHFLAYSGLTHSPIIQYAYYHGADVGMDRPPEIKLAQKISGPIIKEQS